MKKNMDKVEVYYDDDQLIIVTAHSYKTYRTKDMDPGIVTEALLSVGMHVTLHGNFSDWDQLFESSSPDAR